MQLLEEIPEHPLIIICIVDEEIKIFGYTVVPEKERDRFEIPDPKWRLKVKAKLDYPDELLPFEKRNFQVGNLELSGVFIIETTSDPCVVYITMDQYKPL